MPGRMLYLCSLPTFLPGATDSVYSFAWHHCFSCHSSNSEVLCFPYFLEQSLLGPPMRKLSALCSAFSLLLVSIFLFSLENYLSVSTCDFEGADFTPTSEGEHMAKSGHRIPHGLGQSDTLIYRHVS